MISLFLVFATHYLADFALQHDKMAQFKSRSNDLSMRKKMNGHHNGQKYQLTWVYYLTAHASIHALCNYLILNDPVVFLIIFVTHWLIDFGKTQAYYGIHIDQGLHYIVLILTWVGHFL